MKKIITSLAVFLIGCSLIFANTCFAFSDIEDPTKAAMIDNLVNYDIISGYSDGSFKPNASITRAEFAKMIICATGYNFTQFDITENFTDVSEEHWAKDYIYISQKLGIVNGTTPTTFDPENNITYEEAIKMIVCSLGFKEAADNQGGYPQGYMEVANQLKITDGLSFIQTNPTTRMDIAQMINQALDITYNYFYESENQIIMEESPITLREMHNIRTTNEETEAENRAE